MNDRQRRIIGKLLNILDIEDRRLAYLSGMVDYIDITGADIERDFITQLYNHCCEHGTNNNTIYNWCDEWKK